MSDNIHVFGMVLPIIADLGDGWYLAAHRNGACIANQDLISVLWDADERLPGDDHDGDSIPRDVRRKAVEAFERFAWPRLKAEFYP